MGYFTFSHDWLFAPTCSSVFGVMSLVNRPTLTLVISWTVLQLIIVSNALSTALLANTPSFRGCWLEVTVLNWHLTSPLWEQVCRFDPSPTVFGLGGTWVFTAVVWGTVDWLLLGWFFIGLVFLLMRYVNIKLFTEMAVRIGWFGLWLRDGEAQLMSIRTWIALLAFSVGDLFNQFVNHLWSSVKLLKPKCHS